MSLEIQTTRLTNLSSEQARRLVRRSAVASAQVHRAAQAICDAVRTGGDEALAAAGASFGGGRTDPSVMHAEMKSAWDATNDEIRDAIEESIRNVEFFHSRQRPTDLTVEPVPGVRIDRKWSALGSVGAYIPGGKAAYPSSLIMTVVPALAAGVGRIVVASPAMADGRIDPTLLATAYRLGVTEMYAMGGAQAVAALAYGTESIRPVDKIVGPGNAYVTAAKLIVLGVCAIDMPAGPSEVLVIADGSADPEMVAVDLLCQAEHGPDSPALLVTTDESLARKVGEHINRLLPQLDRREILAQALTRHGLVVLVETISEAVAFANDYAAEHVTVLTERSAHDADSITSAGSIYVGHWSPEAAGDYATGANHVLPTGGLARSMNPLGIEDFGTWRQVQTLTESGLRAIAPTISTLATAEGLTAHRLSVDVRLRPSVR
ncbi:MAG: histidinol dehydrogenase [Acidimicrobiia bacterium]|nr:histidinol dehydrogenase [Acidimicrobiia bacterium]MDH5503444.1 histidinol dehydrogenase [Acidimicrobiia bacterium]